MGEDLPGIEDDAISVDVMPAHRKFHHRNGFHYLNDCGADCFAPDEGAEVVLYPRAVFAVEVGPCVPVAAVSDGDEVVIGLLDLCASEFRHGVEI